MNKKINCLIVDDDSFARDLLQSFTQKIPYLNVVAICENAFDAANILQSNQLVDVLITDIQMPKITGMELIKSLSSPPQIIITTAHRNYTLESFELGVADYLIKPFSFERFFRAINRVQGILEKNKFIAEPASPTTNNHLFVYDGKKHINVMHDDILYIEGLKEYVKIVTKDKPITTLKRMKEIEVELPHSSFFRIHKSYIVHLPAIKIIEGNSIVMMNNDPIVVSKETKLKLFRFLGVRSFDDSE
jgi:DNA-binding LytR/AlgR family response regulator